VFRSVGELIGYTVRAIDGDAGDVIDFYFDDREWTVRYLVVKTRSGLHTQRRLVSTGALARPDWAGHLLQLLLDQEQVETSPHIDTHKPISRQMEEELAARFGWPLYWRETRGLAAANVIDRKVAEDAVEELALRSLEEVRGYDIQATDGTIGRVDDLIADDQTWKIGYMVVHTGGWL
jgi:hypothetical protein